MSSHPTNEQRNGDAPALPINFLPGPSVWHREGLTKREQFAAMAMQAILTGAVTRACPVSEWFDMGPAVLAADALLTALRVSEDSK